MRYGWVLWTDGDQIASSAALRAISAALFILIRRWLAIAPDPKVPHKAGPSGPSPRLAISRDRPRTVTL